MDVAALALAVDSSDVVKATADLDRFAASATKAGAAAGNQNGSIARLVASVQSTNAKLTALIGAVEKLTSSQNGAAAAAQNMAAANDNAARSLGMADAHVIAYTQHLAALARSQQDANAHVMAWQNHLNRAGPVMGQADAHVIAYRNSLKNVGDTADKTTTAIKFTAREGLNATRQLADIGTTALMGMNPFLIAIQQGPQLFDILQEKALASGATIGATFRAAGAAIWAALLPLLPVIAAIAAGAAVLAGGFALATREINRGADSAVERLGLTEKQLERVKKAGVDTGVTLSDTFFGFFDVVGDRLMAAFDGPLKWLSKAWNTTLDFITKNVGQGIKVIVGGFTGAVYAIKAVWGLLPGAIADLTLQAANWALRSLQNMINGSIDMINKLISYLPDWLKDGVGGGMIAHVKLGQIDNGFAGQAAKAGQAAGAAFQEGFRDGSGAVGRFFDDVGKAASARRDARILEAAGKADAAARTATPREKAKERDPWADLLANADRQQRALDQAGAQIGVYGEALARLKAEQDLFNQAQDQGIKLSAEMAAELKRRAAAMAARDYENTRRVAVEAATVAHAEQMRQLEVERGALGLTGEALASYRYQQQLINQQLAAGIALKDIDMAKVREQGDAYGEAVTAIERQRQAIADTREVTKGFLSDWINGAREGVHVITAFANAAVNSLNRIIDKLLDKTLDTFLDSMFSGGGSGSFLSKLFGGKSSAAASATHSKAFPNALGGVYGAAQRFAKGAAFTNSIVNTPTLFRFADGAALGEMGEAGPEAIMPLKRGPDGSLGVQMHGAGAAKVRMGDITNIYRIEGAVTPEMILAMVQQGGQATYDQVKRDLQSLLTQLEQDGTVAT